MMHEQLARLLVVEDEQNLATGLKLNFELEGYLVDIASSARQASQLLLTEEAYNVIILDVMLPDTDGFTLCKKIREAGNFAPVLMLTACDKTEDRVMGLEVGADDYLSKPFELSELLARVRSMIRRSQWSRNSPERTLKTFSFGFVRIDFERQETFVNDQQIRLTSLEFNLLRYFVERPGLVLNRQELQQNVWKLSDYPNTRMVDNFVMRLRRYFEPDPTSPIYFLSIRGAGYKFVPELTPT